METESPLEKTGAESLIARYRHWYAHERDASEKMLVMLESVPDEVRADARFARALQLAAHLAACRENYLEIFQGREAISPWWPEGVSLDTLQTRFAKMESGWSEYLDALSDTTLTQNINLEEGGYTYRWNIEGQVFQLLGHAYYHRGQISLLVDQLGGTTVDTDYVDWVFANDPRYGDSTG
ncbi:MAG: DinB family protein [Armatimonadota bacterium]